MKGTESAKNTFGYWWTFFLYATTDIHIAAYFFVYNKLLPWSPNPKRQIFFQMTFFLFFTYFQSWEFAYSSLSILGVKRMNFFETNTLVSQCTILNILVLRLIYCTKCCHKNYFVVTTIRIKVKSLVKKFRKNFTSI